MRIGDLADYNVALPAEGLTIRALFDRVARRARLPVGPLVESNSIDLLKRLAWWGEVATVLTRAGVEMERLRGALAFVPLIGEGVGAQDLTIVHRTSAKLDGATMRFAEKRAELAEQIGDRGATNVMKGG